jgi:thioredoxin reductase (NADPH)
MSDSNFDVIVIGTGIAGLAAAKIAAQKGLRTASAEQLLFGGLVVNINELDGEIEGSGTDYASNLMMETSDLGVESLSETVSAIAKNGDRFTVTTDAGTHSARAVIVASGAKLKRLGVPGEADFEHRGVSQCADCDGPMYKDEEVVVVGGGDSALQEALVLAHFCKRVHLVHRSTAFSAKQSLIDAVAAQPVIQTLWNTTVEAIEGDDMVRKVRVKGADGKTTDLAANGVFAYIGLEPNSDFVPAEIKRDDGGRVITDDTWQTTLPGVFAAGVVRAGCGGDLIDALRDGEKAGAAAAKSLGR